MIDRVVGLIVSAVSRILSKSVNSCCQVVINDYLRCSEAMPKW